MKAIIWRTVLAWLLFLPIPVINGILREKWYKAIVGETAAHQIGTVAVSLVFLLYAYVSLRSEAGSLSSGQLWTIGLIWLVLTLVFEFGMGLSAGRSWSFMLADYKIWQGRIWPLLLAVILLSPFFVKWAVNK